MIVDELDVPGTVLALLPAETDALLEIDTDRPLSGTIAAQPLQAVAWHRPKVGLIKEPKLLPRALRECAADLARRATSGDRRCPPITEAADHAGTVAGVPGRREGAAARSMAK
jgi:hypothetical protein